MSKNNFKNTFFFICDECFVKLSFKKKKKQSYDINWFLSLHNDDESETHSKLGRKVL